MSEQEQECRAWAEREGWDVVEVIEETGSASRFARSTTARTRWAEVTDLVASGRIDILLSWEASRATRHLEEYAQLRNLCTEHGVMWGYTGTVYDLSKRDARFRTGLDALLAEDESARTSERIQRAVRARAAAGAPHGKLPYGYRREYDPTTGALLRQVPDEATAPVVREVVARVAAGDTLYAIAADLTARGVPLPRPATKRTNAAAWIPTTVKRIAASPTYVGRRVHRGEVVGDAQWEALVDEETWERAQAALQQSTAGRPRADGAVKYLCSGIARCGECGGPMVHHVNRGSSTYVCRYCMGVTRLREPVEELVVDRLMVALASFDRADAETTSPAVAEAEAEVRTLHERLDALIEQAASGDLTAATLARVEARLRPQIDAAEKRARGLRRPAVLAGLELDDPRAMWERMDLADRRLVLAATLEVTILKAGKGHRTFNPDLVVTRPRW